MRDIIVIGGSAGSIESLQKIVAELRPDLPAAVFITVHLTSYGWSALPSMLTRVGRLPASQPRDGEPIRHGRIYVAPPGYHLILEKDHIHLSSGPKEQHQRPSINVMFRSAAVAYGPRVIGVVLSGQLDDGTAGLWAIKRRGGVAVVENPEQAAFPSMPLSALRDVEVDHTPAVSDIPQVLERLCCDQTGRGENTQRGIEMEPEMTDLTCPDCSGAITRSTSGKITEYSCRVGHRFSPQTMVSEQFAKLERRMWNVIVAMEEGAELAEQVLTQIDPDQRETLRSEAKRLRSDAVTLREMVERRHSVEIK